jgi:hypothetical protein
MKESIEFRTDFGGVPLVSEAEFERLLSKEFEASEPKVRVEAARAAANATSTVTLGLFGFPESGWLSTQLLAVARDWSLDEDGYAQTRDFYLAAIGVEGEAEFVSGSQLAFANAPSEPKCEARVRGCRPTANSDSPFLTWASGEEGAVGLPSAVALNFESPPGPLNASGLRPALRMYGRPDFKYTTWNEFQCHEEVRVGKCAEPLPARGLEKSANVIHAVKADGIVVVRESEFVRALNNDSEYKPDEAALSDAILLVTQGNSSSTVGLVASVEYGAKLEVTNAIVLRDWGFSAEGRMEGTEWFVFHGRLVGEFEVVGLQPSLLLTDLPLAFDTVLGPCGLGQIPTGSTECGPIQCIPKTVPVFANMRFGAQRWAQGMSRVSMRMPLPGFPTRNTSYLCSEFLPPDDPTMEWCRSNFEECNGVDDNCNKVVDEGGVCEIKCD